MTNNKVFYTLSITLIIVIYSSCSKPKPQTFLQTYYEFTDDDIEKIPSLELEQTIKFKNNIGQEVSFTPDYITDIHKTQLTGDEGGVSVLFFTIPYPGNAYFFHYDMQSISFNNGTLKYGFSRFPTDVQQAKDHVYKKYPSDFIGVIYFKHWNAVEPKHIINIDFDAITTSLTINHITYNKVYTIKSSSTTTESCSTYGVNTIYYDLYSGIIGYDEVDGTEWRLSN